MSQHRFESERVQREKTSEPDVEEGSAFLRATARSPVNARSVTPSEVFDVVVIGAGQAGLAVGRGLAGQGLKFVILDAHDRVGDSWRKRWDSLRLFTPARFDGLEGMPFPAPRYAFPTKDEMADYLEAYAKRFALPVRNGVRVKRLARDGDRYVVTAEEHRFEAAQVVVAMASYQKPFTPPSAGALDRRIVQLHSAEYRNTSSLRNGAVLIVGAGNSGSEIALELAKTHRVILSGRDTGAVPFRIAGVFARLILVPLLLRVVFHRLLTLGTPMGRRIYPKVTSRGGPLIRVKSRDLAAAGVERVARFAGVSGGKPLLRDGRVADVENVIWATGFHPGFSWIDLPMSGDHGGPAHVRGVVTGEPGLYFVGLHFLYAFSSTMIHGVGRDARYVVDAIVRRAAAIRAVARPENHAAAAAR